MVKAVFDTNILIDYLNGISEARTELGKFQVKCISVINYIELLVGITDKKVLPEIQRFLSSFQRIEVNQEIADLTIFLRKQYKLKVPDAIVLASAQWIGGVLVTRNTKDFQMSMPFVHIPYTF